MSNPYDFVAAPNIAGAGNYAQMLASLLNPNSNQKNGQQQSQQTQRPTFATLLQNMLSGASPNPFAAGGQFSPFDSYINSGGDLISAGQITPG